MVEDRRRSDQTDVLGDDDTCSNIVSLPVYGPLPVNEQIGRELVHHTEFSISGTRSKKPLEEYISEISAWFQHGMNYIGRMTNPEPIALPEFQLMGCCMYYNDPSLMLSEETQIVVKHEKSREMEVLHIDHDEFSRSVDFSTLLKGIKGNQDKDLLSVILKQKGKIEELKSSINMTVFPQAIINHINFLARKVVEKEQKIKELDIANKKEKIETTNLRKTKKENEIKFVEAVKNNDNLKKEMMELKRRNDQLEKENKTLRENEKVLQNKVTILQTVSGDLSETSNHTVVIHPADTPATLVCEECPKLQEEDGGNNERKM